MSQDLPLGRQVSYPQKYDASILCPIPRAQGRQGVVPEGTLPFSGEDVWTAYELSWLNLKGKPMVALGELRVPCQSEFMVESKSFKLYLNSFNQTRFESMQAVAQTVDRDLSALLGGPVSFTVIPLEQYRGQKLGELEGECIDGLDISLTSYAPDAGLLQTTQSDVVEEALVSHLLKSNCRITSQPDWASVQIRYRGKQIAREGLLRYLIGFRQHDEFHEPCVEKIYMDILQRCEPEQLTVYARYTRRGGLDINPFRSNFETAPENLRLPRQ